MTDVCNYLWKESLNSEGYTFHQYRQNEQSPLIITELTEHQKEHAYNVGHLGSGLGQAPNVAELNPLIGI